MKKTLLWIIGIAVIVGITVMSQNKINSGKPVVKIGLIYPMTGAMGHVGKDVAKIARFAVDEHNKNPNNQFSYQLIMEDDQLNPSQTMSIAQKLINLDGVDLIISSWSNPSVAIKPLMKDNNIIQFASTYRHDLSDGIHSFNFSATTRDMVDNTLNFLKKTNAQKVALLFQDISGNAEILSNLIPKLEKDGIQYDKHYFQGTELDGFKTMIYKIKSEGYDAVLMSGLSPAIVLLAKEMKIQNMDIPVLGFDIVSVTNYDFTYFDKFYDVGKVGNIEWEKKMGITHADAVYIYDMLNIIVSTYEKAAQAGQIPNPQQFVKQLMSVRDYNGLVGKVHLNDDGLFLLPTYLKQIQGDHIVVLDENLKNKE